MRYPEFLRRNGTIGLVAPSFGCSEDPYKAGLLNSIKRLKSLGHDFDLGPNCFLAKGKGISNTPVECASELSTWYGRKENDVLIACGGGEMMCEILPHVDFDMIKSSAPKWYMGYSDNTNFIIPLVTKCDVAAIYGPSAPAFGMETWHKAIDDTYALLTGSRFKFAGYDLWEKESLRSEENFSPIYNATEPVRIVTYPSSDSLSVSGRLIGGCLDCLELLCGTPYEDVRGFNNRYKNDGILWFLEACDFNVFGIRRAVWKLKATGWFEHVSGFLIGRPYHFGEEMMGLNQYDAATDILSEFNVPIIMDMDIGHLPPSIPLMVGSMATVNVEGNSYTIEFELK